MKLENLIRMANQIGDFFAAMPDREQATRDIAAHLRRTWDPRMRAQLVAALDTPDGQALKPLARDAVRTLAPA